MNEHVQPIAGEDLAAMSIVEQIILKSKTNFGRLPMMEALLKQLQTSLVLALNKYTLTKTEVVLKSFDYVSYGQAMEAFSDSDLIGVARSEPWEGEFVLVGEPGLVFTILQTMLGGRPSSAPHKERNFTGLEKRITAKFYDVVLRELGRKFSEVAVVSFQTDRTEDGPEELELVPDEGACVRFDLEVLLEGQGGLLTFVIPYMAFEPAQAAFAQPFRGGEIGGKDSWRAAITDSLQGTDVLLRAVLQEMKTPLHEVLAWQVGQVLDIGVDIEHEVLVVCNDKQMFRAAMGCRKNGSVALKITKTLTEMDG